MLKDQPRAGHRQWREVQPRPPAPDYARTSTLPGSGCTGRGPVHPGPPAGEGALGWRGGGQDLQ